MSGAREAVRAFHLETANGPRFCLHHLAATSASIGALVYVHAFAEEMNKSRRMAACAARHFASIGFDVLQVDLLGCGDSPGDFGDATWSDWVADVRAARQWLHARSGHAPGLWGLRAGCLLALEAARAEAAADAAAMPLLLWQPPASGKTLAQQFMRLRIAADALRQTQDIASGAGAAAPLADAAPPDAGVALQHEEVAGYLLHPRLLEGFRLATMSPPPRPTTSAWFEVSSRQPCDLLPATTGLVAQWREAGHAVTAQAVAGPGFWQTQEINVVTELIRASSDWLQGLAHDGRTMA